MLRFPDRADPDIAYLETQADPYVDRANEVRRYRNAFDQMRSAAASAAQTKSLIKSLLREL